MKRWIIGILTLFLVLCTASIMAATADGIQKPLIAGGGRYETTVEHGTTVGTIEVWNDAGNLYVKYNILEATDWYINETHLAVATSLDDIPQTKNGNPVPGHFDYQDKFELGVKDYTYTISLASLGESTEIYYIAAQAVVTDMAEIVYVDPTTGDYFYRVETAWGEGTSFPGNNWAMYFTYEAQGVEGNTG